MTVAAQVAVETSPSSTGKSTAPRSGSGNLSASTVDEGRYLPGTMLLDRYRISGLLGRGGMGEVYRATDLNLGQQVALKFLPPGASPQAIERFRAEVRIARQISHRNVCRVYDLGEVEGTYFLSMEYVQGEDLSSLLRRIGRVPGDKALDMARQICSGLAAAHARSVLHRDLKPSNLLVDGEGSVVIVDFGLAAAEEIRAGTPAYMAPEQLEGREVTVRSDIYSLGLVLYELFSGHRALQANSLAELKDLHGHIPASPSTFVRDLDPAIERVILQCLSPDPDLRPQSVGAVAAALPGGDPLAAALAAGETPSPALVAAAGRATGITPVRALILTIFVLAGLAGTWATLASMNSLDTAGIEKSPEIMAERARTLLRALGYASKPADESYAYRASSRYWEYLRKPGNRDMKYPPMYFSYRSSPEQLTNLDPTRAGAVYGSVTADSPVPVQAGMIHVQLDGQGRLLRMQYVTPEKEPGSPTQAVDWSALLQTAGYNASQFRSVKPEWLSDGATDDRAAWVGKEPSLTSEELRIEAAAWKGRLVYFNTVLPWSLPGRQPRPEMPGQFVSQVLSLVVLTIVVGCGAFLARQNLLAGRGDRQGAMRIASIIFGLHMLAFALGADHVRSQAEVAMIGLAIALGLLKAASLWIFYIALEPLARRRWPQSLISWTRLISGRWNDPLAGRDLLIGAAAAILAAIPILIMFAIEKRDGVIENTLPSPFMLGSSRTVLAGILNGIVQSVLSCLATFLILFLLRQLFRKDWIAVFFCGVLFGLPIAFGASNLPLGLAVGAAVNLLAFAVAARFGLTALFALLSILNPLMTPAATLDFNLWYSGNGLLLYGWFLALTLWAFRSALAGRPIFAEPTQSSATFSR
ncbi:MAG: serine/threonine protein kinase [Bryobacteraceae bacterium]|nr:serine/threonine protein kinase [Bryobacteraceae bacterium]